MAAGWLRDEWRSWARRRTGSWPPSSGRVQALRVEHDRGMPRLARLETGGGDDQGGEGSPATSLKAHRLSSTGASVPLRLRQALGLRRK